MVGYTKLFSSIVSSTIWQEDLPTKVVWITLLAMSDKDGMVEGSIPGLAHIAGVTLEECERALTNLLKPDKYSRTPDHEGRRIELVDGGWLILNRTKYRDLLPEEHRRERDRLRQERRRRKQDDVTPSRVTECDSHEMSRQKEKKKEDSKAISSNPDRFDHRLTDIFEYYLLKVGRNAKTYSFTNLRKNKAVARFRECLSKTGGDFEKAAALMKLAVDAMAASNFHMGRDPKTGGKRYCEWEKHLFGSYEQMERWWNQAPNASTNEPNGRADMFSEVSA